MSAKESFLIQLHHSRVRELLLELSQCNDLATALNVSNRAFNNLEEFTKNIAMQIEEEVYSRDLAIKHFPGKWKEAQALAETRLERGEGVDYWLLVRRFYLELGGEYIEQLNAKERGEYAAR